jgi:polyphosphate kinase
MEIIAPADDIYVNRELSWLSFNQRVLQEAKDESVPLYEKLKFLAIYSSNLDEFFRVRVASLRSLLSLKRKSQKELEFDPAKLLDRILKKASVQQEEHRNTYRDVIKPELAKNDIYLIDETQLNNSHKEYIKELFDEQIIPHIMPMILQRKKFTFFLRNLRLYHAVKLTLNTKRKTTSSKTGIKKRVYYAIVEIPTNHIARFIVLPKTADNNYIIFLDDVIRYFLPQIFYGYNIQSAYSVKLTRDAELYIDDEFTGNLLNKIKKSLNKRSTGVPCRFLYDKEMPSDFLRFLSESLMLSKEDLFPGGRHHNFSDFMKFPNPGKKELYYPQLRSVKNTDYESYSGFFDAVSKKEFLFCYPYHSYDYIVKALNKAADDPDVKSIKITQYRVAKSSAIVNALIKAANNGKAVTAFVEVKARFDEEVNIQSAERMQNAGVKVLYSFPGIKVHAKLALISRREKDGIKNYAYLATGNFNEVTSKLYCDYGFMTSDRRITEEVNMVFDYLEGIKPENNFNHLLVAQFNMRKKLNSLIDNEIKNAKSGREAKIILKMNSLEDERMIKKLYEASQAGVKISLIVRGICCIKPGVTGLSDNIEAVSIIDRFLEHGRIFLFHNGGNEIVYLSSADLMKRNLSRRIETAFPVYDEMLKEQLKKILAIQLNDNVKARILDGKQNNKYKKDDSEIKLRAQIEIYNYLKELSNLSKNPALKLVQS